ISPARKQLCQRRHVESRKRISGCLNDEKATRSTPLSTKSPERIKSQNLLQLNSQLHSNKLYHSKQFIHHRHTSLASAILIITIFSHCIALGTSTPAGKFSIVGLRGLRRQGSGRSRHRTCNQLDYRRLQCVYKPPGIEYGESSKKM